MESVDCAICSHMYNCKLLVSRLFIETYIGQWQ